MDHRALADRSRRLHEKAAELRELARAERNPDRRERLLDAASEVEGESLSGAANYRENGRVDVAVDARYARGRTVEQPGSSPDS